MVGNIDVEVGWLMGSLVRLVTVQSQILVVATAFNLPERARQAKMVTIQQRVI